MKTKFYRMLTALTVAVSAISCIGDSNPPSCILSSNGQTDYLIISPSNATDAEKFASKELNVYLKKVTGATFEITNEEQVPSGKKGIYVGQTNFAAKAGIDFSKLGRDEWIISTTEDKNLIICGGRPRGTLYGVYEFLEQYAGCHWLDPCTEIVPSKKILECPAVNIRENPAFMNREIVSYQRLRRNSDKILKENYSLFKVRNKSNGGAFSDEPSIPQYGFLERFGAPNSCHTFGYYIHPKDYYNRHPEYFSLNPKGKRDKGGELINTKFQLCLSNFEVRKIVINKLKVYIAEDRKKCNENKAPYPIVYDISQNDDTLYICHCPECKAISDKEGSEAGLLIDFINEIAEAIEKDYPDIFIQTFAYMQTEKAPKSIKSRNNVLIRYCDNYFTSDPTKPLIDPINNENSGRIRRWGEISSSLSIWDYWRANTAGCIFDNPPYQNIFTIQPDLQFFRNNKVKALFVEAPDYIPTPATHKGYVPFPCAFQSFYPLKIWLGYKLMQNPDENVESLLNTFFEGYYGNAAPEMREYLDYMEKRQKGTSKNLAKENSSHFEFLDLDFFLTVEKLLTKAEDKNKSTSENLFHVKMERIPVDNALMNCWYAISEEAKAKNIPLPFKYDEILNRYKQNRLCYAEKLYQVEPQKKMALDDIETDVSYFQQDNYTTPDEFKEISQGRIRVFGYNNFDPLHIRYTKIIVDNEAAGGKAIVYVGDGSEKAHDKNALVYGAYNILSKEKIDKQIKPDKIPQDEKYHLYHLGVFDITKASYIWASWTWTLQCRIDKLYNPANSDNKWDIYVSLKITGPAYVANSTMINGVWMDRVILIKK